MSNKSLLREEILARRRGLAPEASLRIGAEIARRVVTLGPVQSAEQLLVYLASKDGEASTLAICRWCWANGIETLAPIVEGGGRLAWAIFSEGGGLAPNRFGILEPCDAPRVRPQAEAPVLAPGIVFSTSGYRIGYGGGYYDRFLAGHGGIRIGLAYDFQVVEELPHEPHDQRMDYVVTESRILTMAR